MCALSNNAAGLSRRSIQRVAVLGAGTMGSRIAAHVANAGIPVVLLDIVPPGVAGDAPRAERNKVVLAALESLKRSQPAAFYAQETARLITPGNFEDDLALIASCGWIIEAVAEDLKIKQALLARVEQHRAADSILTTNTSGLLISSIASGLRPETRRLFFGTHFFNPPRYMRLVEIIPTPDTDASAIAAITRLADRRLGKTVIGSRDTPNFIANRLGVFAMSNAIRLMQQQGLTIEEVDALTGTAIGWPKTGTFRLGDLVGIDVLADVARNFASKVQDERSDVVLPDFIAAMVEKKWLGDKTGQGFYKKDGKDSEGRELRQALDWQTLEYRPATRPKFPALEMAANIESTAERVRQLLHGDRRDKAVRFYWPLLTELFTYAANRVSASPCEPAEDIVAVDQAMKAGFNWELGPFEFFDAVGVRETTGEMRAAGEPVSASVEKLLAWAAKHGEPNPAWYREDAAVPGGRLYFDPFTCEYKPVPVADGVASLAVLKKTHGVVAKNPGASVIDCGDGVAAIELHSKRNALGGDIVSLITQTLKPDSQQVADFDAFVITGDSANFSVGANLVQLLLSMQEQEWDEVALAIRSFQRMTQAIKFCPRPVVVAPYGMCLGGGAEISLHAAARQPHAELYMGLVEAGVGLIPGGGGCKEMLLRSLEADTCVGSIEFFNAIRKRFELIARAAVSTSAAEARGLGFLRSSDTITPNRDRLLTDAKRCARALADAGYSAPVARADIPAPGESVLATLKMAVWTMREGEFISDHDARVANKIATVLCGGNVTAGTLLSEQNLLDLEREAFLSLCGEKKTQQRIAYTLKTGKPLRN
ncbi:MAG: 3-hydroxyacyl-CoA dehydrogenase NAD-binding domain-containing protein [Acidobacteriaceae bacterium]|nr:3-hydroxyacyl-CoA dehydrogenase NAD-binding domain-containing protein [Acidobacteriaceae bacterium]